MGNDTSKDFTFQEKVETASKTIWTLHKCTDAEGCPLSVFVYDLTSPHCKPQFVETAAKYLKILRHPYIVRFHCVSHTSKEVWLVTEHVTPLETLLETFTSDEIVAGMCNIIEALSFLHDCGGLCHNNISLSSVFVADGGTWKLGAMECVCSSADVSSSFLQQHSAIRSEKAVAPEEKNQNSVCPGFSRDAYAFGTFAEYILEYLSDLGEKTKSLERIVREDLQNEIPSQRPKLITLLDDSIFRTDFIEICNFLKQITVKSEEEKSKFFRAVVEKLYRLPEQLVATRLVKPLLSRFVVLDHEACEHLIPHLLSPSPGSERKGEYRDGELNPVLSETFFRRYVIPEVFKIFHVRDAHIRCVLLRHFRQYFRLFDKTALIEVIFPQILLSVRDANDELVELSLNAIAALVPVLGGDVIVGSERPKLFYEGIPKFSAVNGRAVPNGFSTLLHSNLPTSNSATHFQNMTDANPVANSSSAPDERRQQKREEARKRMEERRKKREEERKNVFGSKDVSPKPRPSALIEHDDSKSSEDEDVPNSLQLTDRREKLSEDNVQFTEEAAAVVPSPRSPVYERTDSEIELEIEAELEALKLAEKAQTKSSEFARNDDEPSVKLDWSDAGQSTVAMSSHSVLKQTKGRLKLTVDGARGDENGTAAERTLQKTRPISTGGNKVRTFGDDDWGNDSWEDIDYIPENPSASKIARSVVSSPTSASSVNKEKPSDRFNLSRKRSVEEPLGAGYDIMLIDVKTKPVETTEEFDFFADMTPDIKPSGNSLLNILSGKKSEKSVSKSKSLFNQNTVVNSFSVMAAADDAGGWGADLDWRDVSEES